MSADDSFAELLELLEQSHMEYVVIGGHAVNAWLEPRFTADIDVTIQAGPAEIERLKQILDARRYRVTREHGADLPSGPDFVRFVSDREGIALEVQTAKTEFQREAMRRAGASGKVAGPAGSGLLALADLGRREPPSPLPRAEPTSHLSR